MGQLFKIINLVSRPSHNETLHITLHVVMYWSGYDCTKVNTLGSILDPLLVKNIMDFWVFSRSCEYSRRVDLVR